MDVSLRALNRFGFGARIGEARRMGDARGWLRAQLDASLAPLPAPPGASPTAISQAIRAFRMAGQASPEEQRQARQRLNSITISESDAALTRRVTTDHPFLERLIAFWSNHLCISAAAKAAVAPLAGNYERDVIRANVLGRFEDMLLASARHPAMLTYLDNAQSIGPNSPAVARRQGAARQRGLNENYARELLELHSLGVNGGYTQDDVIELARILTGWTVSGMNQPGAGAMRALAGGNRSAMEQQGVGFAFEQLLHEPGPKTVLGVTYPKSGVSEGEAVIRALARHPSTATFLATKLVAHFVADQPPAAAVERLARVYRDSDGDLRLVSDALIDLPEAWEEGTQKFRTPQDWLVAALRALGAPDVPNNVPALLRQLRHPLWSPPSPKGFGDTAQEWADPDSLLNRAELARTITRRMLRQGRDPRPLLETVDVESGDPLATMVANDEIPADERMALAIAGPAFQWR
jgi:uncharacterized protein (DUF1800 family)